MSAKLKKLLNYTGAFASIISALAYLVVTYVIVMGFETDIELESQILFSCLGAFTGLMISFFLRNQGVALAKQDENAKKVMEAYYKAINKKKKLKKLHTIKFYLFWSTIGDIFTKGLTIGVSTWFILYIFMEGNGDYGLFLLAISNILMFAGFGVMNLSKAYDKYLEEHIPIIEVITQKILDQAGSIQPKEQEHAHVQQCRVSDSSAASREEPHGHHRPQE